MHFSKTYSELLLSLPPSLRQNTIEYRHLKKLINAVVLELDQLGISKDTLHELLDSEDSTIVTDPAPRIIYGVDSEGHIRSKVELHDSKNAAKVLPLRQNTAFFTLLSTTLLAINSHAENLTAEFEHDVERLAEAVSKTALPASRSTNKSYVPSLGDFSCIHPSNSFHSAVETNPGTLRPNHSNFLPTLPHRLSNKVHSDLPVWRQVFSIYMDISPFASLKEHNAGERSLDKVEEKLRILEKEIGKLTPSFSSPESVSAMAKFWDLIQMIFDVKKYHLANREALRKILKKHSKRTALPPPTADSTITDDTESESPDHDVDGDHLEQLYSPEVSQETERALVTSAKSLHPSTQVALLLALSPETNRLPRIMVQAISERLLVIVPQIDDYTCAICTSIAFKPIRLDCSHLFCVRCLVKMQKRGQGECPMCRSKDVVLRANRSNVDWALLNFMQDWFPQESKVKRKENEKEATEEEMRELGIDPDSIGSCVVM
ncbi:SPX domain-containing protein [Flagelloscypha sp. PMI_526]|nr:SPX domain-containing protein [Flagelloscypha sp. PMI_526]